MILSFSLSFFKLFFYFLFLTPYWGCPTHSLTWLKMTVNEARHKIVNFLKTLGDFFVITCHSVFNM